MSYFFLNTKLQYTIALREKAHSCDLLQLKKNDKKWRAQDVTELRKYMLSTYKTDLLKKRILLACLILQFLTYLS